MRAGARVVLLLAAQGLGLAGCFSPSQPGCAFACAGAGLCPDSYVCGDDKLCHRKDGRGECDFTPPDSGAGPDGPPEAPGSDGAQDGGAF
jgi:hypothetical protein